MVQAAVTSLQLMTHYANDYFDRDADARAQRTPFSGGSGALVDGSLDPAVAWRAALVCLLAGLSAAALLLAAGRPGSAALLIAIAALAWAYSAPPLRLLACRSPRSWAKGRHSACACSRPRYPAPRRCLR